MTGDSNIWQALAVIAGFATVGVAISALEKAKNATAEFDVVAAMTENAGEAEALAMAADRARNLTKALEAALGRVALMFVFSRLEATSSEAAESGDSIGFLEEREAEVIKGVADAAERALDAVEELVAAEVDEAAVIKSVVVIEAAAEAIKAADTAIRTVMNMFPLAAGSASANVVYMLSELEAATGRVNNAAGAARISIRPHGGI